MHWTCPQCNLDTEQTFCILNMKIRGYLSGILSLSAWFSSWEVLKGRLLLLTQVEELYEAYCLQRRLRDGANKMVKAYTTSPGSKEARESLAEANRGYKEYTEVGEQRRQGQIQHGTVSTLFSVKLNVTTWFRQSWPLITAGHVQNSDRQSQVVTLH